MQEAQAYKSLPTHSKWGPYHTCMPSGAWHDNSSKRPLASWKNCHALVLCLFRKGLGFAKQNTKPHANHLAPKPKHPKIGGEKKLFIILRLGFRSSKF